MREINNTYKSQKLIKIFLKYDEVNNTIHSVVITGDFFIYPEERIDKLEADLAGVRLDKDSIINVIEKSLNGSEIFGFNSQSMADAILGCLNK